ncbi:STAS domain-containing protein [Kitasatospora purpeofusca]|uniref:STAS domain-containing protein n=1 Tax=Kitasatospora purpeofusca TaxID=67352 RepID=UPI00369DFD17
MAVPVWWVIRPYGNDKGADPIDIAGNEFAVHIRHNNTGPVVGCSGELDLDEIALLDGALSEALATCPSVLTVDLGAVTFMDSSGLNALLRARTRAERQGTVLHLADPSPRVLRLLEITGTDRVFQLLDARPAP